MAWEKAQNYLKRFTHLKPPQESQKNLIKKVIKKYLNIDISDKDIYIQKDKVFLKLSSAGKSEFKLQEKQIMDEIQKTLPGKNISGIL